MCCTDLEEFLRIALAGGTAGQIGEFAFGIGFPHEIAQRRGEVAHRIYRLAAVAGCLGVALVTSLVLMHLKSRIIGRVTAWLLVFVGVAGVNQLTTAQPPGFRMLAIIGVLASVVAAFYYIRIVKIMYFDAPEEEFDGPVSFEMKSILVIASVFIVFFILIPVPLLDGAAAATAGVDERVRAGADLLPGAPGGPWRPHGSGGLLLPQDLDSEGMAVFRYRLA